METITTVLPAPAETAPVFYSLPAVSLAEGMSTADGQDVLDVGEISQGVLAHVYTPADDEATNEARRAAAEARVYRFDERVEMADFVNTRIPGRGHPDALVRLKLPPGELRRGDQVLLDKAHSPDHQPHQHPVGTVVAGDDLPELGRQYRIELVGAGELHTNEHNRLNVLRPSGVITEVMVTDLKTHDWYRDHDGQPFVQVEEVRTGDEDDDEDLSVDDIVVDATAGDSTNTAIYDSSAFVQRWTPFDAEEGHPRG